jgi:hypothetical protein
MSHMPEVAVSFDALPLHDAPVDSVHLDWKTKTCTIALHVFLARGVEATPHRLHFFEVRSLSLPHEEPWAPSFYINEASYSDGIFRIQMQSGDTIEIVATGFSLDAV